METWSWKGLLVVLLMLGLSAGGERYKIPCKEGQYLDGLLHICTDCAVACHIPDSRDCQELCPTWPIIPVDPSPSMESPPAVWTNTVLSVVVALSILATVAILVTGVVCVQRRRLIATRGQANGEGGNLRDHDGDGEYVVIAVEEQNANLDPVQEVGLGPGTHGVPV